MPASKTDSRIIKLTLNAADHDAVRLAAALNGTNMADYARQIVLADSRRLTAGVKRPQRTTPGKKA